MTLLAEVAILSILQTALPGAPVAALAPVVVLTPVVAVLLRHIRSGRPRRIRRISPEDIVQPASPPETRPSPEALSRSIVERATEIRKALEDSPSEIRVEMCALGYRNCANDMITLTHLINQELQEAGLVRRLRLRLCRKRATDALAAARAKLPPGALRAMRQEQQ
jgi:hypothetical protein